MALDDLPTSNIETFQYTESNPGPIPQSGNQALIDTQTEINNDPSVQGYSTLVPTHDTDQSSEQTYEMGGIASDGTSYYPDEALSAEEPVRTPIFDSATDSGLAKLNEATEAEKNEQWGTMIAALEQSANEGSAKAHYLLAKHYSKGDIVPKDADQSQAHLEVADQMGYAEATRVLAWKSLMSHQKDGQIEQGRQLMEKAALNSLRAKRDFGMLLLGIYKPALGDPDLGTQYLVQAYQGGDAEAAYQLAMHIGPETPEGRKALLAAANEGHPKALLLEAQYSLKSGDTQTARDFLEKSALGGNTDAMYQLANGISVGKLPSSNREQEAYVWFSVAKLRGDRLADDEIKNLAGVKLQSEKMQKGALEALIENKNSLIDQWNPNAE
ncbi:tetratricopeptide repeat protein [Pseudomonas luteola]